jgi:hypothetical protein
MKYYLFILIFALVIPVSQAYSVSTVSIIPSGSLAPGTSVTASFQINISSSGLSTFPEGNTLQIITDLDNANWTWWILLDGVGNVHPKTSGQLLQITSWELSYREDVAREESVRVLLEGIAPQITATQNKIIFDILELDSNFTMVPDSEIQQSSLIINPADISIGVATLTGDLESFMTEINNKSINGVDTSEIELQYREAQKEITAAKNLPSSQYRSAIKHLTNAQVLIGSGLKDLNEAWVQKTASNAQEEQARIIALQDSERQKSSLTILCILGVAFVIFAIGSSILVVRYRRKQQGKEKP